MSSIRKIMKGLMRTPSSEAKKKSNKKQSKEMRMKLAKFKMGFAGKSTKAGY